MAVKILIIIISSLLNYMDSKTLEGFIVGGDFSDIKDFPHAAFLEIESVGNYGADTRFLCGGSIINQIFILTAAHCLEHSTLSSYIGVFVGSAHKGRGSLRAVLNFVTHEKYNPRTINNDIAIIMLDRALKFGKTVARVAIMMKPPYRDTAIVSGWGLLNEEPRQKSQYLMYAKQRVWSRASCLTVFKKLPEGTFCAGERKSNTYAASGDSGSALVVRHYIQIGLVSYKDRLISNSLVVYTDVGHFYDWISRTTRAMYC